MKISDMFFLTVLCAPFLFFGGKEEVSRDVSQNLASCPAYLNAIQSKDEQQLFLKLRKWEEAGQEKVLNSKPALRARFSTRYLACLRKTAAESLKSTECIAVAVNRHSELLPVAKEFLNV